MEFGASEACVAEEDHRAQCVTEPNYRAPHCFHNEAFSSTQSPLSFDTILLAVSPLPHSTQQGQEASVLLWQTFLCPAEAKRILRGQEA